MRRGFFRLWVVASVLWAGVWLVFGVNNGLLVTPAHEIPAPVDRAILGLAPDASDLDLTIATLNAAALGTLPKAQPAPASFNPVATVEVLGFAASAPALLLLIGWAFAGFARPVRQR